MKKIALAISGLLILTLSICVTPNGYCQSQLEMNSDANGRADVADKKLNATYKKVVGQFHSNRNFLTKLITAEKAWISYRDAYLKSIFPDEDQYNAYGTVFPMCRATWLASITDDRTKQLEKYLATRKVTSDAAAAFKKEEKRLNDVWPKVLKIYDKPLLKHLQRAETTWLTYRDADADAFAALSSEADSSNSMLLRKADLDKERTKELTQWVDGIEEGDVCTGSIPIRNVQTSNVNVNK